MPSYSAPVRDYQFLLHEVLDVSQYSNLPGFSDLDKETLDAILEEGGKFASEVLAPINRTGDIQGCTRHDDGSVTTPDGFKDAYKLLVEGGWPALVADTAYGGGQVHLHCCSSRLRSNSNYRTAALSMPPVGPCKRPNVFAGRARRRRPC